MTKCPYCEKETRNRAGMSSHMRMSHPEKFLAWSKDSVKSGQTRKRFELAVAGRPVENGLHQGTDFKKPKRSHEAKLTHRAYQRNWYRKNKSVAARAKKQPELQVSNMQVALCPKCHCRFGVMIIEG